MCVPVSVVTTGGGGGGCQGICQVWPHVIGLTALGGIMVWNFRSWIGRHLGFRKATS